MPQQDIEDLFRTARVGRLGLARNEQPYVVPINFAYENRHIYFHSAEKGMKMDVLCENPNVCFEVDEYLGTVAGAMACNFDTSYRSAIAFGTARILTKLEGKASALRLIVAKYAGPEHAQRLSLKTVDSYQSSHGSRTMIIEIAIDRMTGKHHHPKMLASSAG